MAATRCRSQLEQEFYHPELNWKTIETDHFYVHYHDGAERTGRVVAKIAEEIYEPVTALYDHRPDQKVSFVIKDYDDISNGAAYFYDNKIEIYAPSMDFDLRGTHNWLRNVVTHEFTHIVQIQTTMKFGRRLPGIYFQWLGYESERRSDVLYGYPNVVVSTPFSGFVVPAWFAEGVAQYNREELRYDFWDTHRDMILRSYALDSTMLTWEQMAVFGKTSLGNESSYNAGFAFVHYLARRYGEAKLAEISRNLSSLTEVTIGNAIERAVGKSGQEVYNEWRDKVKADYAARVAPIRKNIREGRQIMMDSTAESYDTGEPPQPQTLIAGSPTRPSFTTHSDVCCWFNATTGFANLYPAYSPDGSKLAFVSTKNADYFGQSALYVYDFSTKLERKLQPGVRTGLGWSPDGKSIYYGRSSRDNPHWSLQFDIYRYDLEKEEETRITHGKRALSPAVSPDGSRVVFVVGADGTTNLAATRPDGTEFTLLTNFVNGEQVYTPKWSPSGDRIIFDYSTKDGRDIASIRPDGTDLQFIITGADDSRSGTFTHDGTRILFSSDRTGIFNLYSYSVQTNAIDQVTNVLGGAFMPTTSANGDIAYAGYTSGGYKLFAMNNPGILAGVDFHYLQPDADAWSGQAEPAGDVPQLTMAFNGPTSPQFNWDNLRSYNDAVLPALESRPYKNIFTSLTIVPFLRIDNYNQQNKTLDVIKPGAYLFSTDVLDETAFFAGIALNRKLERDLFLQFHYRGRLPGLYQLGLEPRAAFELYNVTRKGDTGILTLGVDNVPVDVSYNLLEFDLVLGSPFLNEFTDLEFRFAHSRYTSILGSIVLPSNDLVPASSDLYLIANDLSLVFRLNGIVPSTTSEINPVGRKIMLRVGRELNKFNGNGEYEQSSSGQYVPVYKDVNFTRVELNWREHIPSLPRNHTITFSMRAGSILGPEVDDFFDFYAGGLVGMKGYPFYSLGGNEMAVAGLTYRFPVITRIDTRILNFYFDKLYASVYGDIGDAWTGKVPALNRFKTDAGLELRLEAFSFYSYPTRIFVNMCYGFDRFEKLIARRDQAVTYGREWLVYFGILFGFDFD
jgi:Tol biopolymer transport system component